MGASSNPETAKHYQIRVHGKLDEAWSDWFGGMVVAHGSSTTTLTGIVADQAALRGILHRLWDLNLVLHSVHPIDSKEER